MLSKKEKKRLYDIDYRRKNIERITQRKKEYYENNKESIKPKYKEYRDNHKQDHLEYCRTDEYKIYKKGYDKIHRNKVKYGEFWECMLICNEIENKVRELMPDKYERLKMRGVIQRNQAKRALKRSLIYGWNYNYS